jgi:sugar O-acyltransferase (sialic acid O-acetyltransferase NeuD family)
MADILIIGGGGHSVSIFDVVTNHPDYSPIGYVDRNRTRAMSQLPIDYLGTDDDLPNLLKKSPLTVIGIGQIKSPEPRINVAKKLSLLGARITSVISTKALVSDYSYIQNGSVVLHQAFINAGCHIGNFNIINSAAVVEHDVTTEDFVHIAPRAIILGDAHIGYGSFIGAGAIIREGVTIGRNCVIGAGVTVRQNVENDSLIIL